MKTEGRLAFGQVPALCINDDTFIFQSAAILRFVGRYAGLYPLDDEIAAANVDALLDQEKDMFSGLLASRYRERYGFGCLDADMVAAVRKSLNDEVLPRHLHFFDNFLARSSSPWLVGGKPTIADFVLAVRVKWLVSGANDGISSDLLQAYPRIVRMVDELHALPQVVSYYAKLEAKET
jgi:glutathione S-transferase